MSLTDMAWRIHEILSLYRSHLKLLVGLRGQRSLRAAPLETPWDTKFSMEYLILSTQRMYADTHI